MTMYRKTTAVAAMLGVTPDRLNGQIRQGRLKPAPAKDTSGDYIWTDEDIANAKTALTTPKRRPAKLPKATAAAQ
jgi:hypothetical protein